MTTRRTQVERVALSDKRMVEAAVSLLVESGPAGMTLTALGERAGYSRGLAISRFGNKAGLLAQVHDAFTAQWVADVDVAVGDAIGTEALNRLVDFLCDFMREEPDEFRALYLLRFAGSDPGADLRPNVVKAQRAQRRDVAKLIAAGQAAQTVDASIDPVHAADLFIAMGDGLIYRWMMEPSLPTDAIGALLKASVRSLLKA